MTYIGHARRSRVGMASDHLETLISDSRLSLLNKRSNPNAPTQTAMERNTILEKAQESLNLPHHVISEASDIIKEFATINTMAYKTVAKRMSFLAASIFIASNQDKSTGRTVGAIGGALQVTDGEILAAHSMIKQALVGTKFDSSVKTRVNPHIIINEMIKALIDGSKNGSEFAKKQHEIKQTGGWCAMRFVFVAELVLVQTSDGCD